MHELNGKTLIFTDLHCGLAGNKLSRLNICVRVVKEIVSAIREYNVSNVVFGGDWYHSRTTLDVNTINVSLKLIQAISKYARLYLVCGNHDSFMKNSTDINSLNMFRTAPNVVVVDKPETVSINSQKCLLVPWLTDLSGYEAESFEMMIGHFEISARYLIQSYIDDNAAKKAASKSEAASIDSDVLLGSAVETKSSSMIGNFVNLVRKDGRIYAGHIHRHKEFTAHGRWFSFVGSPYQQNLGDEGAECGYYVLDERNEPEFHVISSVPKHVVIMMSDAVSGKFDFGTVSGNIIQKVYDIEVPTPDEARVNRSISDFSPYEELLPDYRVAVQSVAGSHDESLDLIRKSKLEYIRNYVDNIDQAALDGQSVSRQALFDVLESYYKKVTEG